MQILSHRGYWIESSEKNSIKAFQRSFDSGFGTETDVRDCLGRLVISHDMPRGNEIDLDSFLETHSPQNLTLAINIKSDGLAAPLKQAMETAKIKDWFVFDMSIPDMRDYIRLGIPVFTRMSEEEQTPVWIDKADGVWLDAFINEWYDIALIDKLLQLGLRVCVVSSELHGRPYQCLWDKLSILSKREGLLLCTDFPKHAKEFFKVDK